MSQSRLARALDARLQEEVSRETAQLAAGSAIDHADYKRRVGVIAGYRRALVILDEAERDIDGEGV